MGILIDYKDILIARMNKENSLFAYGYKDKATEKLNDWYVNERCKLATGVITPADLIEPPVEETTVPRHDGKSGARIKSLFHTLFGDNCDETIEIIDFDTPDELVGDIELKETPDDDKGTDKLIIKVGTTINKDKDGKSNE